MNTMKTAIAKIKEASVAASAATIIIFLLVAVSFVLTMVSGIRMAADQNLFAMTVAEDGSGTLTTTVPALAECLKKGIELVLFAAVMLIASGLFRQIAKDGTPFQAKCVNRLRMIAILLLLNAVVPNLVQCLIVGFAVSWRASGFSFGLDSLFLGMIFFLLTNIFSYGCMLQRESDETV